MIFSDLPSPADCLRRSEAASASRSQERASSLCSRRGCFGGVGSRRREAGSHPRIKSGGKLFRDHALAAALRFALPNFQAATLCQFAQIRGRARQHVDHLGLGFGVVL
jgi:hypothetical protein